MNIINTMRDRRGLVGVGFSFIALACVCSLLTGCDGSSGTGGTVKAGSGGLSSEEKKRMTSPPSDTDKKAMEAYMAKSQTNTGGPPKETTQSPWVNK